MKLNSRIISVLILVMTFLVISNVIIAQGGKPTAGSGQTVSAKGTVARDFGEVLYDQSGSEDLDVTSQNFEASLDTFDNQAADDFVVPAEGWSIGGILAVGTNDVPVDTTVNVWFHNNDIDLPGTAVCTYDAIP
ncbi:MAG TPA: hypothetical protein VHL11_17965, partial [Phototrophicaceae bacterium]|nr:hypothetical protein [Phototrophicaceae bacterium]